MRLGNICPGKGTAYLSSSNTRPIASRLVSRSRPVTCLSGVRVRCSKLRDSTELNGVWGSKIVDDMPVAKVEI